MKDLRFSIRIELDRTYKPDHPGAHRVGAGPWSGRLGKITSSIFQSRLIAGGYTVGAGLVFPAALFLATKDVAWTIFLMSPFSGGAFSKSGQNPGRSLITCIPPGAAERGHRIVGTGREARHPRLQRIHPRPLSRKCLDLRLIVRDSSIERELDFHLRRLPGDFQHRKGEATDRP